MTQAEALACMGRNAHLYRTTTNAFLRSHYMRQVAFFTRIAQFLEA